MLISCEYNVHIDKTVNTENELKYKVQHCIGVFHGVTVQNRSRLA